MPEQMHLPSTPSDRNYSFPEKRRVALVVGVDNAPHSGKDQLKNAVTDARAMADTLREYCGFELLDDGPLLDEQATSHALNDAIRELVRNREDDDFLLFYFSGHGLPMLLRNNREDVYLVSYDFQGRDVLEDENRHISFKWLWERLYQGTNAGKVVIILDCCFAGNMAAHAQDLTMNDILRRLREYFDNLNFAPESKMDGLRQTLAATGYNMTTSDSDGRMTALIVPALRGEAVGAINAQNQVTLYSLREYLGAQRRSANLSGNDANRPCLLTYHTKAPQSYFPYAPDPLFIGRDRELAELGVLLLYPASPPARLCLRGMGGVGKSAVARELVYLHQKYFTDGVFWINATLDQAQIKTPEEKRRAFITSLATLASNAYYLPPNEDSAHPDNEQRARYLCRFLAEHDRTLLVFDDLSDPSLLSTLLSELAGSPLRCAILYTSRAPFGPPGIRMYSIDPPTNETILLTMLLPQTYAATLEQATTGAMSVEAEAARSICRRTGGLPLALRLLRSQLETVPWLTLKVLDSDMLQRGVLAVADNDASIHDSLSATFDLSWRLLRDERTQKLFKLAGHFPGADPIPLWLLTLAVGAQEGGDVLEPARRELYRLGLIESVAGSHDEIQMHRLLREFGQNLVKQDATGQSLLQTACDQIIAAFVDLAALEKRAQENGYWECLRQLHAACVYVAMLRKEYAARLDRLQQCLERETLFLGAGKLWPVPLSGLFYQQMYNRMLENEQSLPLLSSHMAPWLRQLDRVGIEENELLKIFAGHRKDIMSVAFSPDASRIVTGSGDATACIFDARTSKPLHILSGHENTVSSVAFSSDGFSALTGSWDGTACLWNSENGERVRRFVGHTDRVTAVAFMPGDAQLLTASLDGTVRLWEKADGTQVTQFSTHPVPPPGTIPHTPYLFDDESEDDVDDELSTSHNPDGIDSIAVSPDGSLILLGLEGGDIVLWYRLQRTSRRIRQEHTGPINSVAFSPDGSQFLLGSGDGFVRLWSTESVQCLTSFRAHTDGVVSVGFSPNGAFFLTGSWDSTVRLWDKSNRCLLHTYAGMVGMINSVAFSPSGTTILVGSTEPVARLLDVTRFLSPVSSVGEREENSVPFSKCMVFSEDGSKLLIVYAEGMAYLWNVQDGTQQSYVFAHNDAILDAALSPDGTKIATASLDRTACVWDIQNGKCISVCKGHHGPIRHVAFSADSFRIVTGSDDTTAHIWNVENGRSSKTLQGLISSVTCVAFSSVGGYLLTGSEDRIARLWRRVEHEYRPRPLSGHMYGVTGAAFSPDGSRVLTAAGDAILRLWDTSSGLLLSRIDSGTGPVYVQAFSPSGHLVLTGDLFNQIRVWRIDAYQSLWLCGAYATSSRIRAVHWLDDRHILLTDEVQLGQAPRIYRLQLEGFG